MGGIKTTSADAWFSKCVRERADWTCQLCGKKYEYKSQGLHCSHFVGRGNYSVRFHELNAFAHCFGCHSRIGSDHIGFTQHYLEEYGQGAYDLLTEARNDIDLGREMKRSLKEIAKHYKLEHERQREQRNAGKTGWLEFVNY